MLDSTACIDFLNGKNEIMNVLRQSPSLLCVTTISIYEVSIGLERTKRKQSGKRYNQLNKDWLEFLSTVQHLSLDQRSAELAARVFNDLESKGIRIDDNDILICGIMKANGIGKIITRNAGHFSKVNDIEVLGYSI